MMLYLAYEISSSCHSTPRIVEKRQSLRFAYFLKVFKCKGQCWSFIL